MTTTGGLFPAGFSAGNDLTDFMVENGECGCKARSLDKFGDRWQVLTCSDCVKANTVADMDRKAKQFANQAQREARRAVKRARARSKRKR